MSNAIKSIEPIIKNANVDVVLSIYSPTDIKSYNVKFNQPWVEMSHEEISQLPANGLEENYRKKIPKDVMDSFVNSFNAKRLTNDQISELYISAKKTLISIQNFSNEERDNAIKELHELAVEAFKIAAENRKNIGNAIDKNPRLVKLNRKIIIEKIIAKKQNSEKKISVDEGKDKPGSKPPINKVEQAIQFVSDNLEFFAAPFDNKEKFNQWYSVNQDIIADLSSQLVSALINKEKLTVEGKPIIELPQFIDALIGKTPLAQTDHQHLRMGDSSRLRTMLEEKPKLVDAILSFKETKDPNVTSVSKTSVNAVKKWYDDHKDELQKNNRNKIDLRSTLSEIKREEITNAKKQNSDVTQVTQTEDKSDSQVNSDSKSPKLESKMHNKINLPSGSPEIKGKQIFTEWNNLFSMIEKTFKNAQDKKIKYRIAQLFIILMDVCQKDNYASIDPVIKSLYENIKDKEIITYDIINWYFSFLKDFDKINTRGEKIKYDSVPLINVMKICKTFTSEKYLSYKFLFDIQTKNPLQQTGGFGYLLSDIRKKVTDLKNRMYNEELSDDSYNILKKKYECLMEAYTKIYFYLQDGDSNKLEELAEYLNTLKDDKAIKSYFYTTNLSSFSSNKWKESETEQLVNKIDEFVHNYRYQSIKEDSLEAPYNGEDLLLKIRNKISELESRIKDNWIPERSRQTYRKQRVCLLKVYSRMCSFLKFRSEYNLAQLAIYIQSLRDEKLLQPNFYGSFSSSFFRTKGIEIEPLLKTISQFTESHDTSIRHGSHL